MLFFLVSFAQKNKKEDKLFRQAQSAMQLLQYDNAVNLAKQIINRNRQYTNAHLLLADLYSTVDSVNLEIKHLNIAKQQIKNPIITLRLGKAHFKAGNYQQSLKNLTRYLQENPNTKQEKKINRLINCSTFGIKAKENSVDYQPILLDTSINTSADEYWPQLSIDNQQIYFTRLIKAPNYLPQEDLFTATFDSIWQQPTPLPINTNQNEGTQAISADGRILFFTACNREDGYGSCDIYYSIKTRDGWIRPQNAGKQVNTNQWEAQPSFSSDNQYLYFSSKRKGGKGKKDIWRVKFNGIDKSNRIIWGKVTNLGDSINTKGDEISPFIHPNGKNFYFASNEKIGLGGFDLFYCQLENDSLFSNIKNMGYPINSYKNEQGLFITSDGQQAFYASERDEIGGLDIYHFTLDSLLQPQSVTYANIYVIDAKTQKPIKAIVSLNNIKDSTFNRSEQTDIDGKLLLCLPIGNNYGFSVSKEKYLFYSENFDLTATKTVHQPYQLTIKLIPLEKEAEMTLHNIYFATDSYKLLPKSKNELWKLYQLLTQNPTLVIQIEGHTDNVGDEKYNQQLSEKRARSVVEYLIEKGISINRLTSKGFGENKPTENNRTEKGRRKNRRTTVRVINI